MPFVPIPTDKICNLSSRQARYIATTVCRRWQNFEPHTWHTAPEIIDLRPDGSGTISSSYNVFTHAGVVTKVASQDFTWRLAQDGPFGMEGLDEDALYNVMPKLMKSTKAWTHKPWSFDTYGMVPAYTIVEVVGESSLENAIPEDLDFRTYTFSEHDIHLPTEIIEKIFVIASSEDIAATESLRVCKWSREIVMHRRRKERFAKIAHWFSTGWGTFYIYCGHFVPPNHPKPPTSLYALCACISTLVSESLSFNYYSCELPIPEEAELSVWTIIHGRKYSDEHPEVPKKFDEFARRSV